MFGKHSFPFLPPSLNRVDNFSKKRLDKNNSNMIINLNKESSHGKV